MKLGKLPAIAGVALALTIVTAAAAPVTSLAALGANDSIDWGQIGTINTTFSTPLFATSTGGINAVVTSAGNQIRLTEQSNGWAGNFTPGEQLLWTNLIGPDITITFGTPVYGVGAQIQADFFGAFTAEVQLSNGDIFTLPGNSTSNGDGSAIFLGELDGVSDISSIRFDLTSAVSNSINDFAIGTLYLRTGPVNVPEPLTLSLFGTGFVGATAMRRRMKSK